MFHRVLPTHALALSVGQFVRKKKAPIIMHSGAFELMKLTYYTRHQDLGIDLAHRRVTPDFTFICFWWRHELRQL